MDINIEKATLIDAPRVATMIYMIYDGNQKALNEELRKEILAGVLSVIMSEDRAIFVATIMKYGKRQIIGMVGVRVRPDPVEKIVATGDYFFVEPKFRGREVAMKLLQASKEFAEKLGATKAYIEADPIAIPVLLEFGFKHESTIMSYKSDVNLVAEEKVNK